MAVSVIQQLIDYLNNNTVTEPLSIEELLTELRVMQKQKQAIPDAGSVPTTTYSLPLGFVGTFQSLPIHIERASLVANLIHLTPIGTLSKEKAASQKSGSPYAQRDAANTGTRFHTIEYSHFDPDTGEELNPNYARLRNNRDLTSAIQMANARGVRVLADVVLNHVPPDNLLFLRYKDVPGIFFKDSETHVTEVAGNNRTVTIKDTWDDVVKINWPTVLGFKHSPDEWKKNVYNDFMNYFKEAVESYVELGFDGLRFDAAHLIHPEVLSEMQRHFISNHNEIWGTRPAQIPFLYETLAMDKKLTQIQSAMLQTNNSVQPPEKPAHIAMADLHFFIEQLFNGQEIDWFPEQLKRYQELGFIDVAYTATHDTQTLMTLLCRQLASKNQQSVTLINDISGNIINTDHAFLLTNDDMTRAKNAFLRACCAGTLFGGGNFYAAGEEYLAIGQWTVVEKGDPRPFNPYSVEEWQNICHNPQPLVDFRGILAELKQTQQLLKEAGYRYERMDEKDGAITVYGRTATGAELSYTLSRDLQHPMYTESLKDTAAAFFDMVNTTLRQSLENQPAVPPPDRGRA